MRHISITLHIWRQPGGTTEVSLQRFDSNGMRERELKRLIVHGELDVVDAAEFEDLLIKEGHQWLCRYRDRGTQMTFLDRVDAGDAPLM